MNDKNIKLFYSALGSFMLVLLQTNIFQDVIGIFNVIGMYSVAELGFFISKILSIVGVIVFIICSTRLILNNFKFKM